MDLADALRFARSSTRGVLATLKRDGRPQLSNIAYTTGEDGLIRVSLTEGRAKTANARRDPRASLHVTSEDFWAWVVIDGTAELSQPTTTPGDEVGRELADLYRQVAGEHPDWDEFFAAMVAERRLVLRLTPTHAYGQLRT
jgi:PPOX class probable F420-dependent enzyme